jgi:preprotein translocase SecE subunit
VGFMAKKKVIKDALVEEEKVKKAKKEEVVEEVKTTEEPKKETKKVEKKEKVKKEKPKKEKKDGFFRSMRKEMKKVSWPGLGEVAKYSFAVVLFCLIFVGFFKLVELFAAWLKVMVS